MAAGPISERNQDATIYVGGLDEKVRTNLCRIRIIPDGIGLSPFFVVVIGSRRFGWK
jgi:hypothetical protein